MERGPPTRNGPCGACKYQRRRCDEDCLFAPYFPAENIQMFACVHHVFGAANVGNVIKSLRDTRLRKLAVNTLAYQAEARVRDPTYGVVGHIMELEQRHREVQEELATAKAHLAQYLGPEALRKDFSSKGKSVCEEAQAQALCVEADTSPFRRLSGDGDSDSDVEMWDPFPPWGTSQKDDAGPSSQQAQPDRKGKRPADFP